MENTEKLLREQLKEELPGGTFDMFIGFLKTKVKLSHITELSEKIGINNKNPEYVLDVKAPDPVETQLTGTFSFNGFQITGNKTLMLSELTNGATIKVVSTGNTYVLDFIMSDTDAFSFSGGDLFTDEVCVITVSETKYFNFLELLKSYNQFGDTVRENNEKVVYNKSERIYNSTRQNIYIETNIPKEGQYTHSIRRNGVLVANLYIVERSEITGLRIANINGWGITFYSNNTIEITGLPTTRPTQPNFLYKNSNGFLKIS